MRVPKWLIISILVAVFWFVFYLVVRGQTLPADIGDVSAQEVHEFLHQEIRDLERRIKQLEGYH